MKVTIYVENVRATASYNEPEIISEKEREKIVERDADELLSNEDWVAETLGNNFEVYDLFQAFTDMNKQDEVYSVLKREALGNAEDDFDERWFRIEIEV